SSSASNGRFMPAGAAPKTALASRERGARHGRHVALLAAGSGEVNPRRGSTADVAAAAVAHPPLGPRPLVPRVAQPAAALLPPPPPPFCCAAACLPAPASRRRAGFFLPVSGSLPGRSSSSTIDTGAASPARTPSFTTRV